MTATFHVGDAIEVMVRWCEEHQTANRPNTLGCWIGYDLWEASGKRDDPHCRLVEKRLVSVERVK